MNSKIMSNSIINAVAGLLLLVSGFGCSVIVARLLGPQANGTIAFALWLATTGSLVAELGTGVLLLRLLPQLKAKGVDERGRRGFAAYLALPVAVATTILVLLFGAFCWLGGGVEWIDSTATAAALTALLLFIQSIGSFTKNYLISEQRLRTFLHFTSLTSILQIVIVFAGAYFYGVEGALIGYIAGQSVFFLYTSGILLTRPNKAGHTMRALAGTSVVLFFEFVITAVFLTRPELVFLQHFRGVEQVGFYAVALSLANLALQLPVQLTGSLIPFYAERQGTGGSKTSPDIFAGVVRSFSYITFPLCFGLAAIAMPLVLAIYGPAFEPAGLIVAIMAVGAPAYVFIQLVTQYLYSMDRLKYRLATSGIGAVLMVAGCLFAVPQWGGTGAAVVRDLVFLIMSVILLRRVDLAGGARELVPVVVKVAAAGALCGFAALTITRMLPGVGGLVAGIAGGAVVYGLMLRLLAAVPRQDAAMIDSLLTRLPSVLAQVPRLFLGLIAPYSTTSEATK
ncbi:lipopolysaccharide biosynthesis protein [Mesorhizobium sp. SP-1A]|uniref:lipopolysaccharide biosynthesis protein n=1 Tax=Mesorhizobium sp. SP-1A TaxID=3077840 RepID=UPI0028F6F62D|nr:polysaccharide biosynthesis C-terminal domain-containing protein [Mesorhizobium sp. SP-1A]